jgi:hypothetical protein
MERVYGYGGMTIWFKKFINRMETVEGGRSGLKMKNYYENDAHKSLFEARFRPTIGWNITCENNG